MTDRVRSQVMDLFGEYLRYADHSVRVGALITLLTEFGVEPATTRVTLSRMRRDGWFTTHRVGRETIYKLTRNMVDVLVDGRQRIFGRDDGADWDGQWTQVIYQVPESARIARDGLRKQLIWLGFGQLAHSIWMSPHPPSSQLERLAKEFPDATIDILRTRSVSTPDVELARRCWDLGDLADSYRDFHKRVTTMSEPASDAAALTARTRLVAEARRLTFLDPLLPAALEPPQWPGRISFGAFREQHRHLGPPATRFVEGVLGRPLREIET